MIGKSSEVLNEIVFKIIMIVVCISIFYCVFLFIIFSDGPEKDLDKSQSSNEIHQIIVKHVGGFLNSDAVVYYKNKNSWNETELFSEFLCKGSPYENGEYCIFDWKSDNHLILTLMKRSTIPTEFEIIINEEENTITVKREDRDYSDKIIENIRVPNFSILIM